MTKLVERSGKNALNKVISPYNLMRNNPNISQLVANAIKRDPCARQDLEIVE